MVTNLSETMKDELVWIGQENSRVTYSRYRTHVALVRRGLITMKMIGGSKRRVEITDAGRSEIARLGKGGGDG